MKAKKTLKSFKMVLNKDQDTLEINPELKRDTVNEAKESHVVMAFGRMNPPTTGHLALVNKMHEVAKEYHAKHVLVASHSQDAKKNPLSSETKVKHLKRFFPNTHIISSDKETPTFLQHAKKLHDAGHTHLHMIAGSDRVDEYKEKLNHYNGEGEKKLFNFKHITVHSSGERDPDAEGTSGMSASKMREHASNNDYKSFKQGVPSHVTDEHAKELFHDTRRGMKLEEAVLDIAARRKRSVNFKRRGAKLVRQRQVSLKRFASELKLRRRAREVARNLMRTRVAGDRGANYNKLSTGDKIAVDRLLQGKEKAITALATRLYQRVRKKEAERVTRARAGLSAKSKKILNASLDYDTFSGLYDTLTERHFQITEKELLALNIKSRKSNVSLDTLKEVYIQAANNYESQDLTLQQYCFNAVNSFIAESSSSNIARSHLIRASTLTKQGKFQKANIHRKIASALSKNDHTTATGLKQQLRSINESFVIDRSTGVGVTYFAKDLGIKTEGGFAHHPSVIKELQERELNELVELAYPGNIGAMEMAKFYSSASPEQKSQMKLYLSKKNFDHAIKLLHTVTGVKLK